MLRGNVVSVNGLSFAAWEMFGSVMCCSLRVFYHPNQEQILDFVSVGWEINDMLATRLASAIHKKVQVGALAGLTLCVVTHPRN